MSKDYLVKSFMRDDVYAIKEDQLIRDAIVEMAKKKTNALVVVDDEHHLKGIITSWGVIEHLVPDYLEGDKHLASFEASAMFKKRAEAIAQDSIASVMSTNVRTVHPNDTLMEAATQISQFHIRQLPVVDDNHIVVGYINHTDIKWAMLTALGLNTM